MKDIDDHKLKGKIKPKIDKEIKIPKIDTNIDIKGPTIPKIGIPEINIGKIGGDIKKPLEEPLNIRKILSGDVNDSRELNKEILSIPDIKVGVKVQKGKKYDINIPGFKKPKIDINVPSIGIPKIITFGHIGIYNILVMELLGKSLGQLFKENKKKIN